MIGEGYPYHDICLCGSRPSGEIKKIDLTIEVMQFMFRWIDEATDILRIVYMNKKQTPRSMKERINKAIGTHDSSMLSLLGGVKEINTKKKKGRSGN